jgi:aspartate racemase
MTASDDRVLGIVGGTGPESTIDYYRMLVAAWKLRRADGSYPRVIINSLEAGRVFKWLGEGNMESVGRDLGSALQQLGAAGCGRALIASNACHLAFDHIAPTPMIPLIHIVEAARDAALSAGYHRLALLGTRFVATAGMYPDRFARAGMEIVVPSREEQDLVHAIYVDELVAGVFSDDSRDRLVELISTLAERDSIDAVILGGTELALTLTEPTYAGIPLINTAHVHVTAAVDWLLAGA